MRQLYSDMVRERFNIRFEFGGLPPRATACDRLKLVCAVRDVAGEGFRSGRSVCFWYWPRGVLINI